MLKFKKKKATDKEHAHEEMWYNGRYLGYIMKNQSGGAARVGENWNFVSNSNLQSTYDKTRYLLIAKIVLAVSEN
jgi:hypothetical protein